MNVRLADWNRIPLDHVNLRNKTDLSTNRPVQIVPLSLHLCSGSSKVQRGSGKCTPSARTFSCIFTTIICKLGCCT